MAEELYWGLVRLVATLLGADVQMKCTRNRAAILGAISGLAVKPIRFIHRVWNNLWHRGQYCQICFGEDYYIGQRLLSDSTFLTIGRGRNISLLQLWQLKGATVQVTYYNPETKVVYSVIIIPWRDTAHIRGGTYSL